MRLYFVGILRNEAGTVGASVSVSKFWTFSASLQIY